MTVKLKNLKQQIMSKCKYFNGLSNAACKIGIPYVNVKVSRGEGKGYALPCLLDQEAHCSECEIPTEVEADAKIAEHEKRFGGMMTARKAIVDDCGGPWKKGGDQKHGQLSCPVCTTGVLRYSRAAYNGHIHAQCSTKSCVAWME
jgi:hypothetical protein